MILTHQEKSRDYKKILKSVAVINFGSDFYQIAPSTIKCVRLIRKIFFLRNLQLRSTETFYEFSIYKVHSFQETYKDMSFRLKSTSFKPKTSEQMKYRYAFKLYPENTTGLDRTGSTKFFLQSL
jgi:hypothetical protein